LQNGLLFLGQLLVAPIERRAKSLVPRQRRAAAAFQDLKTIVQAAAEALDAEDSGASRGQLDRQSIAVQCSADFRDDGSVNVGQMISVEACRGAFDKKLDGRE
jgi:hypothetical protein